MPEEYDWSLLENAVEYSFTGWQPEEGSMVVGVVAYVTEGEGNWGPYPMVAIISRENVGVMVHAFHTVLRNEIERQDPRTGDRIAIKYMGTRAARKVGQDPTHIYNVVVDHSRSVVAAAELQGAEAKALPEGERPEPAGWEPTGTTDADGAGVESHVTQLVPQQQTMEAPKGPHGGVTGAQANAIDNLCQRLGEPAVDWSTTPMSMQEASALIKGLQER